MFDKEFESQSLPLGRVELDRDRLEPSAHAPSGLPGKWLMTTNHELLQRITARSDVFGGKPIIRDMRIAVEHILGMLSAGDSTETILREYPILEPEDIQACLLYAHRSIAGEELRERIAVSGS